MSSNPFIIQNSPILQGLQSLEQSVTGAADRIQEDRATKAKRQRQQLAEKAFFQSQGSPDRMMRFAVQFPEYRDIARDAFGYANEQTRAGVQDLAIGVLGQDDPMQAADLIEQSLPGLIEKGAKVTNLSRTMQDLRSEDPQVASKALMDAKDMAILMDEDIGSRWMDMQKMRSEEARKTRTEQLKVDKEALDSELKDIKNTFDRSSKLRGEYNKASTDFNKVRDAFGRIEASVDQPDAAGDLALIFNYMKMLDPGSTVREGEFATAQNAGGVTTSVMNMYNKLVSGERLQPAQRKMFSNRAEKLFNKAKEGNERNRKEILSLGKRYNLTEEDIFGAPVESPEAQAAKQRTQQDQQALEWARANPDDPRAARILQLQGR